MKKTARLGMLVRMDRYIRWCATLAVTVLLAACGTMRSSVVVEPAAGGYYDHHPAGSGYGPRLVTNTPTPARTPIPGGNYAVVQGDTLYSIAFRKGVDFRDLAQWNGIAAPYTIWPGQRLTLSPPTKGTAAPVAATPGHAGGTPVATAPVPH